ncbi:peptidase S1 [Brevundimonas sp. DC300-4]|uniref:peptidase S1 n=1 Tax=Brevundimonas sp. DC300-4 TaxID=2804594 RepID=UPI003CF4A0D1
MIFTVSLCVAAIFVTGASAQQSVSLSAGFVPDPVTVELYSGGGNQASDLGRSCVGTVGISPDVVLNFSSAGGRLAIGVLAGTDTSLVINGPDGRFYCNDDNSGLNPGLVWGRAPSGQYDIWVGAVGDAGPATLVITEGSLDY